MQFLALMIDGFRESRDRKLFWVMLLMSLSVASAMFCVAFKPNGVDILFGTWQIETDVFTIGDEVRADIVATVLVEWIADTILGWIGVIIAIIATAGFFPTLMERGVVEVLLSKPMPRWGLFLAKYLGSMVFLLVHATIFVGSTFLVAGFRWGVWVPGYLLTIPLVVLLFSYLYCVSVLVAVYTRNAMAAVLLTLVAWTMFATVQSVDDMFVFMPEWKEYRTAYQASQTARWIVPKTQDIPILAKRWAKAATAAELIPINEEAGHKMRDRAEAVERARMAIHPALTIGSSLLFEAFVVMLAMWKFSRKDY